MALFTKICGLNDPVGLATALEHGADMCGFVFFPPSPRSLSLEQAEELLREVPTGTDRVGVFVDRSEEHTSELQSLMRISYAVVCLKNNNLQTNNSHYIYDKFKHLNA